MTPALLLLALCLDALLGEPAWLWSRLPHPAVVMGRGVGWLDTRLNSGHRRRAKGVLALAALLIGGWALARAVAALPLGPLWEALLAAILLAQRSLVQHVTAVADALDRGVAQGRDAVGLIVGRDTAEMDSPAVARAAIESAAENFSDAVVAPAFWFLVLGLPGLVLYKAINTADSMIGYRTPRHEAFGWAAARLDDAVNWIPARLSALVLALAHGVTDLRAIRADARLHRSPNAGWPEAAIARALGVALAGPRSYDGRTRPYPWVNMAGQRRIGPPEIRDAVAALWRAWAAIVVLVALAAIA